MSIHIDAKVGDIANTVLLPGDPLRAKYVAENILKDSLCYNKVRGMYGFTGMYQGKRISIQGTGMGIPSCSIYIHELITEYQVKNLIRVGTCGSIQSYLKLRDVILAMTASTDSNINKLRFQGMDYSPTANFDLLKKAFEAASEMGKDVKVGSVFSTDTFYHDDPESWSLWAKYGVLALEMETSALYTLAAKFRVNALSILTVSDDILNKKRATAEERENSFTDMIQLALEFA
jgi:purine-nucleoside phosphorylase